MSQISQDELDRLLLQIIASTAPNPPDDAEAQAVVAWAEGVRIGEQMLAMILKGEATVRIVNGEAMFKLTAQGMASAEEKLLQTSPAARDLHDQIVADSVGKPLSKGPDDPQ